MSKVHESAFKSVPKGREGSGGVWMARRFLDRSTQTTPGILSRCTLLLSRSRAKLAHEIRSGSRRNDFSSLLTVLETFFKFIFLCGGEDGCCFNPKVMFSCTSSPSNLKT